VGDENKGMVMRERRKERRQSQGREATRTEERPVGIGMRMS
jgi:hypothetical protein